MAAILFAAGCLDATSTDILRSRPLGMLVSSTAALDAFRSGGAEAGTGGLGSRPPDGGIAPARGARAALERIARSLSADDRAHMRGASPHSDHSGTQETETASRTAGRTPAGVRGACGTRGPDAEASENPRGLKRAGGRAHDARRHRPRRGRSWQAQKLRDLSQAGTATRWSRSYSQGYRRAPRRDTGARGAGRGAVGQGAR